MWLLMPVGLVASRTNSSRGKSGYRCRHTLVAGVGPASGGGGGCVAVEAGVGGEFGGQAFGGHGGAVDFDECPEHRVAGPVVQQGVGDDGLAVVYGVVDFGQPVERQICLTAAPGVLEEGECGLGHRQGVAGGQPRGHRIGHQPGSGWPPLPQLWPLQCDPRIPYSVGNQARSRPA